jgi:predicted ABC-type transport system involved in lysophospholipase L1 biosynthesis ATPase subunit
MEAAGHSPICGSIGPGLIVTHDIDLARRRDRIIEVIDGRVPKV